MVRGAGLTSPHIDNFTDCYLLTSPPTPLDACAWSGLVMADNNIKGRLALITGASGG